MWRSCFKFVRIYARETLSLCASDSESTLFFHVSSQQGASLQMCAFKLFFFFCITHKHRHSHARPTHAHTHAVVPDFTAGSYSVMHLYHPSSSLPYRSAQNDRASTSIYISSLTPTCELQKAEDALASSRLLHLCPSRPLLSLILLLLRLSKPPVFLQSCQSPKSWPR